MRKLIIRSFIIILIAGCVGYALDFFMPSSATRNSAFTAPSYESSSEEDSPYAIYIQRTSLMPIDPQESTGLQSDEPSFHRSEDTYLDTAIYQERVIPASIAAITKYMLVSHEPLLSSVDPFSTLEGNRSDTGGMETWTRPDGKTAYRGIADFPQGLSWSRELAEEITQWLSTTYTTEYSLGAHIAEYDENIGAWVAPMTPENRKAIEKNWGIQGLDCVGFVNGFYYLYTLASAGDDYTVMDRAMKETSGVYGNRYSPLADAGFDEDVVIKPSLGGTYADENHIRAGDINESHDHVWIVYESGKGYDARLWEYEPINGFADFRTLRSVQTWTPGQPYDYWLSGIGNPLEDYSEIHIIAMNREQERISGGEYKLVDHYGRSLALEDQNGMANLFRPDGNRFFHKLFDYAETDGFYREDTFGLLNGETTLKQVIGGRYFLKEVNPPSGYTPSDPIPIDIEPGMLLTIEITYGPEFKH